jgi:hypothetical protein
MKVWKVILAVVLVTILMIVGCATRAWQQDRAAKQFCESLIPRLEQARKQSGSYPTQADPVWWTGQNIPSLIHTQSFYFAHNYNDFGFYFQNDSWIFDNAWEFSGPNRRWFSYDSNHEKK